MYTKNVWRKFQCPVCGHEDTLLAPADEHGNILAMGCRCGQAPMDDLGPADEDDETKDT